MEFEAESLGRLQLVPQRRSWRLPVLILLFALALGIRLIGVGVSNLEPAGDGGQLDLFFAREPGEEKWARAEAAIDEITERFGKGIVEPGTAIE